MSENIKLDQILNQLSGLEGTWKGSGTGTYPTIDSFQYEETLSFKFDMFYPLIAYEQKTILIPENEPSHWETGFIIPLEDGSVEFSNAQGGSRVEVLKGIIMPEPNNNNFKLELNSVVLAHDERLLNSKRIFALIGDALKYKGFMSTNTTESPKMMQHTEAALQKSS